MELKKVVLDEVYDQVDFTQQMLAEGGYDGCIFRHINFATLDLSFISFTSCVFEMCNLSSCKLHNTAIRDTQFIGCKMLGLNFDTCNPFLFSPSFDDCVLNLSSFYELNLKKSRFKACIFHEVDFTEADLQSVKFDHCDFNLAIFDRTNIEKADFTTSFNYAIDININKVRKAKFSKEGIIGLLKGVDVIIE